MADIFFMMKSDKMIDAYIDFVINNVPANLEGEELEDRLLLVAERMR